jgi:hypothetical protein
MDQVCHQSAMVNKTHIHLSCYVIEPEKDDDIMLMAIPVMA